MDAAQLTYIHRAVATATGLRPKFGFTSSADYADSVVGRREVVYNGAVIKPCCTAEEEILPLALTLTFEDESVRSLARGSSKIEQFIASRPHGTNIHEIIAAYKNFVPDDAAPTSRAVNGEFFVYGTGRIEYADGSAVDISGEYNSTFIPPGDVRFYGTIQVIVMIGPSLTAVTFVPSILLNVFFGFLLAESSVSSLDLTGLSTIFACLLAGNPYLTSVDFTPCTSIQSIYAYENSALTTLSVTNLPNLTQLWCYDNSLNILDISGDILLIDIDCSGNYLDQTDSDDIAAKLDDYGGTNGTYTINPQKVGGPITVTGGDYDSLTGKDWTIT